MTPQQLLQYRRDANTLNGLDPDNPANKYYSPNSLLAGPQTNWMDVLTKKGLSQNYELSMSGGNEKTTQYTSASYNRDEGVFHGVNYEKYQIRSNIDQKLGNKFTAGVRVNGVHTKANDVAMQSLYYVNPMWGGSIINPWTPVYNPDGTFNLNIPANSNTNPLATSQYDRQWEKQNRFLGTVYLEYKPISDITLKTNNSAEYTDGEGRRYWSAEADPNEDRGTLQVSRSKYMQLTTSNTAVYNKLFNVKHALNIIAGQEATRYDYNSYYIYSPGVDPSIPFPTTSTSDQDQGDYDETAWTMLSFFGNMSYSFDRRYYLQASIRTDGSSKFGKNNRWGTFYSVGASWNLHNEAFMSNLSWLNLLKIRASYGVNGNDRIGDYEQYGVYGARQYDGVAGLGPDQLANPDLTWEVNKASDIGLDFGFFDKVKGTIDLYDRKTTDMLLNVPLSRTSGFSSLRQNIGELDNKGIEFSLDVDVIDSDIKWNVGFNVAHNVSEIISLGGQDQFINTDNSRIVHKVGEHLYSFYLYDYAGVNPVNGDALWYNEDGKLTNLYSQARRIIAGSPEPKLIGGFNSTFSWKGLSLDVFFEFKAGNKVSIEELHYLNSDGYFWNRNQMNSALDYWKAPGDVTVNPRPIPDNSTNSNGYTSTRWMQDGDYLRIKNLTLSYTLPSSLSNKVALNRIKVYGSAVNLYTFHDVTFYDPERGEMGSGFGIYPQTKKFVVGLDIAF